MSDEIAAAIAQSVASGVDMDEDELEAELDELEAEQLDELVAK